VGSRGPTSTGKAGSALLVGEGADALEGEHTSDVDSVAIVNPCHTTCRKPTVAKSF